MAYPYAGREELTEGDWEEAWAHFHKREERMMVEDFLTACQGSPDADVSDLDWLASVLAELRETNWPAEAATRAEGEDRTYALTRTEALLINLRWAVENAQARPAEAQ